jgi:hypothetical protein
MFDWKCPNDHIEEHYIGRWTGNETSMCSLCSEISTRVFVPGHANSVIGDEIDITIKHGLCHPDGTPRRFRSRAELERAKKKAGWESYVRHVPPEGTDKSKFTSKWT